MTNVMAKQQNRKTEKENLTKAVEKESQANTTKKRKNYFIAFEISQAENIIFHRICLVLPSFFSLWHEPHIFAQISTNDSLRPVNFNTFHFNHRKCPFRKAKLIHLWFGCNVYSFRGDTSVMIVVLTFWHFEPQLLEVASATNIRVRRQFKEHNMSMRYAQTELNIYHKFDARKMTSQQLENWNYWLWKFAVRRPSLWLPQNIPTKCTKYK